MPAFNKPRFLFRCSVLSLPVSTRRSSLSALSVLPYPSLSSAPSLCFSSLFHLTFYLSISIHLPPFSPRCSLARSFSLTPVSFKPLTLSFLLFCYSMKPPSPHSILFLSTLSRRHMPGKESFRVRRLTFYIFLFFAFSVSLFTL